MTKIVQLTEDQAKYIKALFQEMKEQDEMNRYTAKRIGELKEKKEQFKRLFSETLWHVSISDDGNFVVVNDHTGT